MLIYEKARWSGLVSYVSPNFFNRPGSICASITAVTTHKIMVALASARSDLVGSGLEDSQIQLDRGKPAFKFFDTLFHLPIIRAV